MGKLYLIRHAPSKVAPGQIAGRSDVDARLPSCDVRKALRSRLPEQAAVWCSPARRCQQTAAGLGLEPQQLVPALWEQDFGAWEGQSWQTIGDQPGYWADPIHQPPPGGESFFHLTQRVTAQIPELTAALQGGDLVVVLHAGPIRALVAAALNLSLPAALRLSVDPFSLTVLQAFEAPETDAPALWSLERLNEGSYPPAP